MSAPDARTLTRFRTDVAAALGRDPAPDERLALAISGGPDSMTLLALAAEAFPGQVTAATVDHGLRAESAEEASMVERYCRARAIPHATLRLQLAHAANLQAEARTARYAALTRWATASRAALLLTAHHADDQAETFLMRAARASGVAGLAGIRAVRSVDDVALLRPLLGWTRAELRSIADAAGVPYVDDPSNDDLRFDRTRARRLLAETPWLNVAALARSAKAMVETDNALREITEWFARRHRLPAPPDEVRMDMGELPREIRRRLAREAIGEIHVNAGLVTQANDSMNVEALLDSLERGCAGEHDGVAVASRGSIWRFRAAPPRRSHRSA